MSDKNGVNRLPPPDLRGAVNLQASLLRDRVKGIIEAKIADPIPRAPVLREEIGISHGGDPGSVDVNVVREQAEAKRWSIIARLRMIGVDENDGDFSLREIGYGQDQQGRLTAHFMLEWTLRASAGDKKPALSILEN